MAFTNKRYHSITKTNRFQIKVYHVEIKTDHFEQNFIPKKKHAVANKQRAQKLRMCSPLATLAFSRDLSFGFRERKLQPQARF